MPDYYRWDGTRPGGFSEFGKLLQGLGAELRTVQERVTREALAGIDVFIIVDPDAPAETDDPKYIEPAEIDAMKRWVRDRALWHRVRCNAGASPGTFAAA